MSPPRKTYLGDGAYVEFRNLELILTTENGVSIQNRVVLGYKEWLRLVLFVAAAIEWAEKERDTRES